MKRTSSEVEYPAKNSWNRPYMRHILRVEVP